MSTIRLQYPYTASVPDIIFEIAYKPWITILSGESGTGKTYFANLLSATLDIEWARASKDPLLNYGKIDVLGSWTPLDEFKRLVEIEDRILFVDNYDYLESVYGSRLSDLLHNTAGGLILCARSGVSLPYGSDQLLYPYRSGNIVRFTPRGAL